MHDGQWLPQCRRLPGSYTQGAFRFGAPVDTHHHAASWLGGSRNDSHRAGTADHQGQDHCTEAFPMCAAWFVPAHHHHGRTDREFIKQLGHFTLLHGRVNGCWRK